MTKDYSAIWLAIAIILYIFGATGSNMYVNIKANNMQKKITQIEKQLNNLETILYLHRTQERYLQQEPFKGTINSDVPNQIDSMKF